MQLRDRYPVGTVTNCCFVTGNYDTSEGIVDLDVDLDTLPAWGRLCVSPKAVAMMMSVLGWELPPENVAEANRRLKAQNTDLKRDNLRLREALEATLAARDVLESTAS